MPKLEFLVDVSCNKIIIGKNKIGLNFPYKLHTEMDYYYNRMYIDVGSLGPSDELKEKTRDVKGFIKKAKNLFPRRGIHVQLQEGAFPFMSNSVSLDLINSRERQHCYVLFAIPVDAYSFRIERH